LSSIPVEESEDIFPLLKIFASHFSGADANLSVRGRRPLHLAASKGFCRTAALLIAAGADATAATTSGRTPLLNATSRGSVSTVNCILAAIADTENRPDFVVDLSGSAFVDMSQIDTGRTALSLACEEDFDEIIGLLLDAGASASLADRWGRTPLYYAARYGKTGFESIQALATDRRGKEAMKWGESGHNRSPLHVAVWHGHVHAVRALLDSGADPNLVENDGGGPLHEAAYMGSYGYDRDCQKNKKQSNDSRNHDGDRNDEVQLASRLEILRFLLGDGRCLVDMVETHGCTPCFYAAAQGWTSAVNLLLDAGASVNPSTCSPLATSLKKCHFETARLLLARGARLPATFDTNVLNTSTIPDDLTSALLQEQVVADDDPAVASLDVNFETVYGTPCLPVPKSEFAQTG